MDDILHGTIAYPFVDDRPIGINARKEKFVVRSIVGGSEYVVEIPGAGDDYDIEVPFAAEGKLGGSLSRSSRIANPTVTDREMANAFPNPTQHEQVSSTLVDKAFGVGPSGGIKQSPSYTLGIARISELYRDRKHEYALIEINHMLSFYPTSPRLHKMKGTVLLKMGDLVLAERAWVKALELTPNDQQLDASLVRLRKRIALLRTNTGGDSPRTVAEPISPATPN